MRFIQTYYIGTAIFLFMGFGMIAHIIAPVGYSFSKDALSALEAQGYDKKIIMQLGFLSLGILLASGLMIQKITRITVPLLLYALSMAMVGIFCAAPYRENPGFAYAHREANAHGIFSQIAAISFWIAVLFQMIASTSRRLKIIHLAFLSMLAIFGIALRFMLFKDYPGLIQRILFLISFMWLIKFYNPVLRSLTTQ